MIASSDGTMPTLNIHRQWVEIMPAANRATNPSEITPGPDVSQGGKGLHHAQGLRPGAIGQAFGHQRAGDGEDPAAPTPVMKQ